MSRAPDWRRVAELLRELADELAPERSRDARRPRAGRTAALLAAAVPTDIQRAGAQRSLRRLGLEKKEEA